MRSPRAEAYPENVGYRDTGCAYAPRCLECPFRVCRYDVGAGLGIRTLLSEHRDREIREARARGESRTEIAQRLGVSVRTVDRVQALHSRA